MRIDVLGLLSPDKAELQKVKPPKDSHQTLHGRIKPKPGQIIFEINESTGEITEAKYKNVGISFCKAKNGDFSECSQIDMKEGHIYIPAINKKNAIAKFTKNKTQAHYYATEPILTLI